MNQTVSPLPRMFEMLQTMIAAVGEEVVDAAVARVPDGTDEHERVLATLTNGGRDIQVLTEACAILIRRRSEGL